MGSNLSWAGGGGCWWGGEKDRGSLLIRVACSNCQRLQRN